ncbi:MAG: D-glycero-beta-D-manno-heptose 1-phosphate adenylyltransferase [Candidatus Cloacimonadaceae bacterium]|jgi:rfaE bifunctional protein nucleotidyltransferase chain/domain|nr:D-glycero-beta-D-manno-heptose 1-phosphate adenylyltransferase [Candidatus Cloacimonadota bacterium]MDD5624198.1 D-glycero-beta-D-manno-heptose 1-phosphate adenylyltransferase [Candidatus Cloacimonadota bacterium]MDY0111554.1 D-glycero-beta-D-manno-heptose 1-phosphate adenylyltransferase [Candidatus Syntrophosphaera sp.]
MIKDKIKSWEESSYWCEKFHSQSKKVVFTNGCFDILHSGHIQYLEQAKALGDILVLGLNSDDSVRRIKGAPHPIVSEKDRAFVVAGLQSVDIVVIFEQDTPYELIRLLKPDILVKGGDWKPEDIVGADFVQAYGGKVLSLPYLKGVSTTKLFLKIAAAFSGTKDKGN